MQCGATTVAAPPAATDEESARWREIGFVLEDEGSVASNWSPLMVPEAERGRRYGEITRIGALYALDLVGHIKDYPDSAERFVDVMREIVEAGAWTGLEIGFFHAMSSYIADGRVSINGDFEVIDLRRAA